jgi:hypothetical protein
MEMFCPPAWCYLRAGPRGVRRALRYITTAAAPAATTAAAPAAAPHPRAPPDTAFHWHQVCGAEAQQPAVVLQCHLAPGGGVIFTHPCICIFLIGIPKKIYRVVHRYLIDFTTGG